MAKRPEPHTLLARALATLSEEERGIVLKSLLPVPTFARQDSGWNSQAVVASAGLALGHKTDVLKTFSLPTGSTEDQTPLLVRLPAQAHAELKAWSESHGHSMNAIVRVLIERFLSSQEDRSEAGST